MNEAVLQYKASKFCVFTLEEIVIDEKGKKKMLGMPKWKNINQENFNNYCYDNHLALAVLTGNISGVTVIDFDLKDGYCAYEDIMNDFPELRDCYTVQTWSGGYHVYCLYDAEIKTTTNAYEDYKNIDIRNDDAIVFAPPTKVYENSQRVVYRKSYVAVGEYKYLGGEIFAFPNGIKK